jgi:hypothetical protein
MSLKVVCHDLAFNDTYIDDITIGKTYEVLYSTDYWPILYTICNDAGIITGYSCKLFTSIEEWRNKQLDLIGI